jgi:Transposase family tnp2
MGMPPEGEESPPQSSSSFNESHSDDGEAEPVLEADEVMQDQHRAMDKYMVDWFGVDPTNESLHVTDGEPVQPNDPRPRHRPEGQHQWEEAEKHARTPIFDGARLSRLSAILGLMNIQAKYKASNALISDIFAFCHDLMLPCENVLPSSWKEAKGVLSSIGMDYHIIHACVNDCMLFHGANALLTECDKCGEARYDGNMLTKSVPRKSVRWFPIIPRLLHMYRCSDLAELMVWHKTHRSEEGVMRLPVDSLAHKHVESTWPEFEVDPRHVRLGLASDGVSPHSLGGKGRPTSVWPVVVMNYNLPPWLSMKKGFLFLSLIIPGPNKVKSFDTYLALLIEELQKLWSGVWAYDGRRTTGGLPRVFKLKGLVMWTMHDYPGNISLPYKFYYD